MEEIMNFLVENYIYVALGSLFLIIVLIGIVVSSNRKRKKANNPDMVSMSDVTTGSINDVANNLNPQNDMEMPVGMKPLNVAEVYPSQNQSVSEEPVSKDLYAPMGSVPVEPVQPVEPIQPEIPEELLAPMGDVSPVFSNQPVNEPVIESRPIEPTLEPAFGIPAEPMVQPITEIPVHEEPTFGIPTEPFAQAAPATPEVLDVMDVPKPEPAPGFNFNDSFVEVNPLNGDAAVSDQNNNLNN